MLFEIKHRFKGSVLFSLKTSSLKLCVSHGIYPPHLCRSELLAALAGDCRFQ